MMHQFGFNLSIVLFLALLSSANGQKPNIVFVLADDLGWADVGYNGATFYETPNIDALSAQGIRFTDAYPGASNCMPSRAIIMTGTYITRTQMWTPGSKAKGKKEYMKFLVPRKSDNKGDHALPSSEILDPKFVTIPEVLKLSGYQSAHFGKWHLGPHKHGFEINDTNGLGANLSQKFYNDENATETLTSASIKFIEEQAKKDSPFFLYLAYWDVHVPFKAKAELIAKYDDKLKNGPWYRKWNTTYAAMIEAVDTNVGRVYDALKKAGIDRNTVFIFSSDNGGHAGATPNDPLRGAKGAFYEGGIRVPTFAVWPGVIEKETSCPTPITGVDFLPTFADIAGARLPRYQSVDGRSFVPLLKGEPALEDRSIFWHYPLYLEGSDYNKVVPIFGTKTMYWRATPCSVVRKGDWKLIQFFETDSVELYNVRDDIGETNELSNTYPEKALNLLSELKRWQKETRAAIPKFLNPEFKNPL